MAGLERCFSITTISNAMLMAAGLGTRLKPFTDSTPKPLLPVLGTPMAQFAVDLLLSAGVRKIVANVHHLPKETEEGLKQLDLHSCLLEISDEREKILGSAGGIRHALEKLGNAPFFLLNSDVLIDVDLRALSLRHEQLRKDHGVAMTIAVQPGSANGNYRELYLDYEKGLVTGFGVLQKGKPFFAGAAVIEPELISCLPDNAVLEFVPAILEPAIKANKVGVFFAQGLWFDIGSPLLWRDTHIALIKGLEENSLPRNWSARIKDGNRRVGTGCYVNLSAPLVIDITNWSGPSYWSNLANRDVAPPLFLGNAQILYGEEFRNENQRLKPGIGINRLWVSL